MEIKKIVLASVVTAVVVVSTLLGWSIYRISPQNVLVTNVTDRSATITWETRSATPGIAVASEDGFSIPMKIGTFGDNPVAYDDRDVNVAELEAAQKSMEAARDSSTVSFGDIETEYKVEKKGKYYTHHVTFKNLEPEKEYSYLVGNGVLFLKGESNLDGSTKFKTYSELESVGAPYPIYGSVVRPNDSGEGDFDPAKDAIVYLEIVNDDEGIPNSTVLSSVVSENGNWYLDASVLRSYEGETLDANAEGNYEFVWVNGAKGQTVEPFFNKSGYNSPMQYLILEDNSDLASSNSLNPVSKALARSGRDRNDTDETPVKNTALPKQSAPAKTSAPVKGADEKVAQPVVVENPPAEVVPPAPQEKEIINAKYSPLAPASTATCDTNPGSNAASCVGKNYGEDVLRADGSTVKCTQNANRGCDAIVQVASTGAAQCGSNTGVTASSCINKNYGEDVLRADGTTVKCTQNANNGCDAIEQTTTSPSTGCNTNLGSTATSCINKGYDENVTRTDGTTVKCTQNANRGCDAVVVDISSSGSQCGTNTGITASSCIGKSYDEEITRVDGSKVKCARNANNGCDAVLQPIVVGGSSQCGSNTGITASSCIGKSFGEAVTRADSTVVLCTQNANNGCDAIVQVDVRGVSSGCNANIGSTASSCYDKAYDQVVTRVDGSQVQCKKNVNNGCDAVLQSTASDSSAQCDQNFSSTAFSCYGRNYNDEVVRLDGSTVTCTQNANRGCDAVLKVSTSSGSQCDTNPGSNSVSCAGKNYGEDFTRSDGSTVTCTQNANNGCDAVLKVSTGSTSQCGNNTGITASSCIGQAYGSTVNRADGSTVTCTQNANDGCDAVLQASASVVSQCGDNTGITASSCIGQAYGATVNRADGTTVKCTQNVRNGCDAIQVVAATISESSLGASSNNLVLGVNASETSESVLFDTTGAFYTFAEAGRYSIVYNGAQYDVTVGSDDQAAQVFIDANENGVFDVDEIVLTDNPTTLNVRKEASAKSYDLKQGINFVSMPFVMDQDNTAQQLLAEVNKSTNGSLLSIAQFDSTWKVSGSNGEVNDAYDFQIIPGKGYLIVASRDVTISLSGKDVIYESESDNAPVSMSPGWNLVGLYGTGTKPYTAESLIDGLNSYEPVDLTADNVTRWATDLGRYQGLQKETDESNEVQVYGFDFPIQIGQAYFVRVTEGQGDWQPKRQN